MDAGSCSICMCEDAAARSTLPCGHSFHADCIVPWLLQGKPRCPLCRRRFDDEVSEDGTAPEELESLSDDGDEPFWTKVPSQHGPRRLAQRGRVVRWILARLREKARLKGAPPRMTSLFARYDRLVEKATVARGEVKSFSTRKGTWATLRRHRERLWWRTVNVEAARANMESGIISACSAGSVRLVLATLRPLRRPYWWA